MTASRSQHEPAEPAENLQDFPVRHTLQTYALRLLERDEQPSCILDLAIEALSPKGQQELHAVVAGWRAGTDDGTALPSDRSIVDLGSMVRMAMHESRRALSEAMVLSRIAAVLRADRGEPPPCGGLDLLEQTFRLDAVDLAVMSVAICCTQSAHLAGICSAALFPERLRLVALLTSQPLGAIRKASGRSGRLVTSGIMNALDPSEPNALYTLNADILEHVFGLAAKPLTERWCRTVFEASFSPGDFDLEPAAVAIMTALVRTPKPCNILIHGAAGCGKTEFVKAIAAACGKKACFVGYGDQGENRSRRVAIEATINSFDMRSAVVVVDEADGFLNTRFALMGLGSSKDTIEKSWLNDLIENARAQIVWIANNIHCIEESTRRRFTFSLEFKRWSLSQRRRLWHAALKDHPVSDFVPPDAADDLARRYQVNAAGITDALASAARVVEAGDGQGVEDALRLLLVSHEKLTGQKRHAEMRAPSSDYDASVVHTDVGVAGLLSALRAYAQTPARRRHPLNILFWGPPGTGKTACARHLAQSLGLEILVKRASDLLSMYVGGTEQAIREAFEEAARDGAILLLDEADSFFIDRHSALRSWESSQTNELLTQMENHCGVLVCCTNLLDRLDHAAMRRFAWKIKFLPLTPEGRLRLYRTLFAAPGGRLSAALRRRLDSLPDLTAGDLHAVRQRHAYAPPGGLSHEAVLAALEREAAYRRRGAGRIGFGA